MDNIAAGVLCALGSTASASSQQQLRVPIPTPDPGNFGAVTGMEIGICAYTDRTCLDYGVRRVLTTRGGILRHRDLTKAQRTRPYQQFLARSRRQLAAY